MTKPRQPQTFSSLCRTLNRPPATVRDLQKRFGLPALAGAAYDEPYLAFLRKIVRLRVFGVGFTVLTRLWNRELALMRLLHADTAASRLWFLDFCVATDKPERRLMLSGFDTGVRLTAAAVQLGLDFGEAAPELFTSSEIGEDALHVLRLYMNERQAVVAALGHEMPVVRDAIAYARSAIQTATAKNGPVTGAKPESSDNDR